MKKMKLFFTAMMVLLASAAAMAQDVTVTGVVRDASTGEPVPFASIQIKGTLSGGSTDADGNYEILVSDDAVLVFTSIGYQAQEIAVDGRPQINVALEPDSEMLDETIVVAFGTTTKEAFTGSAKVLKSDELLKNQTTNVSEALVGKVAGVQFASASGRPGSTQTMYVRGYGSVNEIDITPGYSWQYTSRFAADLTEGMVLSFKVNELNTNATLEGHTLKVSIPSGFQAGSYNIVLMAEHAASGQTEENGRAAYQWIRINVNANLELSYTDCINQIKDLQEMVSGELIVGVTYSFCPVLTETVKNFIDAYPGVKLRIVSKSSEELISMLRKREVDFVLAFKPNESYDDIESQILFDDRLSVILRNDHPLAGRSSLRMEDLQRQKIALPAKGLQARNALDKSIDIVGQNLNICIELNEINILLDIVQSSHVLTILSEATIYHHKDRLKAIPLEIPQNQMEGCIHVLRKAYRKRSAEAFVRLLRESNEIMERIHRWL